MKSVKRKMETLELDQILAHLPSWWNRNLPEESSHHTSNYGTLGARHPIKKPNTTPPQRNVFQAMVNQDNHKSPSEKVRVKGEKNDWYSHLTGLIGWWRRVEIEHTKLEEKYRKIREERKNSSVAKLSFVNNILIRQNRHEKSKHTPTRQPSIDRKKFENEMVKIVLSPSTKRKAGGEGGVSAISEFCSPGKRQRKFNCMLKFWEEKSKISQLNNLKSKMNISAETTDDIVTNLEGDNRFGGSLDSI